MNALLAEYSKTNTENLKNLRKGCSYDVLESLLHQTTMLQLANKLKIKIAEAKAKSPDVDVSEQEKMIADLSEIVEWTSGLQKQYAAMRSEVLSTKAGMMDLIWLNQMKDKKIEQLQEIIDGKMQEF